MRNTAPAARLGALAALVGAVIGAGACGGGSGSHAGGSGSSTARACSYVAKLDTIAKSVADADVADPDGFKKTLDAAVHEYVTNLGELRTVAPADLHASLDRVQADVQQYRFAAAAGDRAELDVYAQRECGRAPSAPTSTIPGGTTIAPSGPGTSTVPSTGG